MLLIVKLIKTRQEYHELRDELKDKLRDEMKEKNTQNGKGVK